MSALVVLEVDQLKTLIRQAVQEAVGVTSSAGLMTLKETGISVRTLRAEISARRLEAVKVGREYRIRRDDFERWIEARKNGNTQPGVSSIAQRALARARESGALTLVGRRHAR